VVLLRILAVATVVTGYGCVDEPDACERATARLRRIEAREGRAAAGAMLAERSLKACRSAGTATLDPVLQCAMQSATDDDAKICIDAFLNDVLKVQPPVQR
jgi:hypothetical protein